MSETMGDKIRSGELDRGKDPGAIDRGTMEGAPEGRVLEVNPHAEQEFADDFRGKQADALEGGGK